MILTLTLTTIGFGLLTLFILWIFIASLAEGDLLGTLFFGGILFLTAAYWVPVIIMVVQ